MFDGFQSRKASEVECGAKKSDVGQDHELKTDRSWHSSEVELKLNGHFWLLVVLVSLTITQKENHDHQHLWYI